MNFLPTKAPHIKVRESSRTMMDDCIIALVPLYFMALYYYGARTLVVGLLSVVTCLVTDMLCTKLAVRKINLRDHSAVVTGMILALLMPASIPYYIVVAAGIFAIAIVKHPFGGTGQNIFNPAAGGFAFVSLCWPRQVFSYPAVFDKIPIFGDYLQTAVQTPGQVMKMGGVPKHGFVEMLLGNFGGPMGATNILVVLACMLFLIYRNVCRWQLPVSFLVTSAAMAFLFPRVEFLTRPESVMYELMSGSLLFCAVFMLSDPVTSPKRDSSKVIYGLLAGVIVMLCRWFGLYEENACFAVLLMNAFGYGIDWGNEWIHQKIRGKKLATALDEKVS